MRRLLRWLVVALLVLLAAGWIAKRALLDSASVPEVSTYALDLAELRRLARAGGALPLRVNVALVAEATVPRAAVIAGGGFQDHLMVRTAYQVVYPEGSALIDAGYTPVTHRATGGSAGPFHQEAWDAVREALRAANPVVVTHEHPDHIGGVALLPSDGETVRRVKLTREQLENTEQLARVGFPEELRRALEPLSYEGALAVAPGMVLVKAPGHTPGSQLVYVALRDGTELLFVGDVAWHMDNVSTLTGRPLLVSRFLMGEDRDAVLQQLRALHDLVAAEPDLHLVVSHDAEQLRDYVARGLLGERFEVGTSRITRALR